jgi:hypothetical protein
MRELKAERPTPNSESFRDQAAGQGTAPLPDYSCLTFSEGPTVFVLLLVIVPEKCEP